MKKKFMLVEDGVDGKALAQFEEAMKQDFVVAGALMPDTHAGYTLPIGAVVLTEGVIVPSYIGYDIGCGMLACCLNLDMGFIIPHREKIHASILNAIPVGFAKRKEALLPDYQSGWNEGIFNSLMDEGVLQIGTLGGGNHFIEVGWGEDRKVWIVIHSGSRGVGHKVASHYMALASGSDKAKEGHYPIQLYSDLGEAYLNDMMACANFALQNRQSMLDIIIKIIEEAVGFKATVAQTINKCHNYAEFEAGSSMMIHRKGATSAKAGEFGVIPGNLRDGSYIVRGLGREDSLQSCSHGAGRKFSRSKAKEMITLDDFETEMLGTDIVCNITSNNIDESPMAYKNIGDVIQLQVDEGLIEVVGVVKPLINVKA